MANAYRDENSVPTLIAASNADGSTPVRLWADPVTHRLLVDLPGGGSGTVTSVSVVSANGFAGTVATATSTPAITISTSITGVLKGNGTAISAATDGTDYLSSTTGLKLDQTSAQTIANDSPIFGILTASQLVATDANKKLQSLAVATYPSLTELSYVKGVTSAIQTQINAKGSGTVTAVSVATANGVSGSSSGGATPALTITLGAITPTTVNGNTITTGTGTLTLGAGKTLTVNNSIALTGTDSTTMTFPTTSKTVAANDGSNWAFGSQASGDIAYASSASAYARLAKGTDGQVLTLASGLPSWATPSAGGASFWTTAAGTPTRASNTTFTMTGDYTTIFAKGMVIKWTESSTVRVGMVSIPSTYGAPNTTVTIIGDTMASIDASSLKYALIGAEMFTARFAIAGNIGATATDVANVYYATEPMRVLGAELQVGTAGTTNSTTIDLNKGGTTMFTTKPTLASTVATTATPFTADSATSLALNDKVSMDIDAVQTTPAIDLYAQLYLWPTRYNNL
jgi:hypothetical protein